MAGGIATAAGQVALVAFARDGVGWLQFLAQPGGAARLLLIPGALALAFAYLEERNRAVLASLAAAGFVLAVVHPTYIVFVVLPLIGFLLARAILSDALETQAILAGLGAILVPAGLFLVWLAQFAGDTGTRPPVRFTMQVETVEAGLRLRPDQLAFGGGIKVAALLVVPLALLAARQRWAAYVLGGTAVLSVVALVPPAFEHLADAISLSQAVRLASFLPLPFALAGAAVLAARRGLVGAGAALAGAAGYQLAYGPGATGAGWAMWLAALGSTCGLAVFGLLSSPVLDTRSAARWTVIAAVALTLPVAIAGLGRLERWGEPDPYGLTPGLESALDEDVPPLSIVLAPSVTSYRLAGAAPVRIVVAPPGHVAFNTEEDYHARSRAARRFFLEPGASLPSARRRCAAIPSAGSSWTSRAACLRFLPGWSSSTRTDATRSTASRRRPREPVESRGSMPRRRRPSRSSLALRWLGVAALVVIALSYVHPLRSYRAAEGRVAERETELVSLQRENAQLQHRLSLSDDDVFIEREARRLGLVVPGERPSS